MLYNLHRILLPQSLLLKREQDNFHQTSTPRYFLEVCHYGERSTLSLNTVTEPYGHLDRMHRYVKCVQGVKPRIRLDTFSKTLQIISPDNWFFLLKLIPMGLSF